MEQKVDAYRAVRQKTNENQRPFGHFKFNISNFKKSDRLASQISHVKVQRERPVGITDFTRQSSKRVAGWHLGLHLSTFKERPVGHHRFHTSKFKESGRLASRTSPFNIQRAARWASQISHVKVQRAARWASQISHVKIQREWPVRISDLTFQHSKSGPLGITDFTRQSSKRAAGWHLGLHLSTFKERPVGHHRFHMSNLRAAALGLVPLPLKFEI